jgi:hypothetical protein
MSSRTQGGFARELLSQRALARPERRRRGWLRQLDGPLDKDQTAGGRRADSILGELEARLDLVRGPLGQRERGFADGPLGPNVKPQWEEPFTWEEAVERSRSFTVPGSAHAGLDASDFFCTGVAAASDLLDVTTGRLWRQSL